MAEFKADPFRARVVTRKKNAEGPTLADVLQAIHALPRNGYRDEETRWGHNQGNYIELDHLDSHRGHLVGTAFHLRISDLPQAAGPSGPIPIPLKDEDGLGKHVAFLLDTEQDVLWIQRDRSALPVGQFADYLRDKSGYSIECNPILDPDALDKASRIKDMKELRFGFAATDGAREKIAKFPILREFWSLQRKVGAYKIEIRITPERGERLPLSSNELAKQVIELAGIDESGLKTAVIKGILDSSASAKDAKDTTINMLHDRFIFSVKGTDEKFRNPKALMKLIESAWKVNKDKVQ